MMNFLLGMIDFLIDALWRMFVPSQEFLQGWQEDISGRFNDRMGNIIGALSYISSQFAMLREYRDMRGIFEVRFPPQSFLYGIRMNILAPAREFISWLRFALTGVVVLMTALLCYGKARRMISK